MTPLSGRSILPVPLSLVVDDVDSDIIKSFFGPGPKHLERNARSRVAHFGPKQDGQ